MFAYCHYKPFIMRLDGMDGKFVTNRWDGWKKATFWVVSDFSKKRGF